MKKIIKIVFSLLLVFILFGCEKNKKKVDDNKLGISYTVGFNYEDDNNNPVRLEKKFSHGEILGGVDIGGKKGHDLIGWYLNNQLFYFGKEVLRNLELYAKYTKKIYKVELNPQNGENTHKYDVEYNTRLFPTRPTKDNHIFLGWYKDDKLYDLDKPITENLSLVAKWAKEKHLVRINFKKDKLGNDVYKEVYITHGETLKADDFIFDGKRYEIGSVNPDDKSKVVVNYFDETNNTIFDLNTKITDDKLVLKPIYDDVYLTYVLNILGKKVEKNVRYGSSILHKQSDFEEVFNKYFDGVRDDSNNLIDENYKLTESGKEFYVKYYNGVPDEGFLYTLNDTKTGYNY